MTAEELGLETIDDNAEAVAVGLPAAFIKQGGVEEHLVEHVAELFDDGRPILSSGFCREILEGDDEFVGLFPCVFLEALMILPARPGAASPQSRHGFDHRLQFRFGPARSRSDRPLVDRPLPVTIPMNHPPVGTKDPHHKR